LSSKIGNKAAAETCPLQSAGSQLAPSDPKPIQVVQLDSMRRDAMSLTGTKIEYRSEDDAAYVPDYPLLPVRWRFWEKVLRAVDMAGTAAQLRNQFGIVYESVIRENRVPACLVVQPADDFPRDGFRVAERHENAAAVREQFDGVPVGCRDRHLARAWIHRNLRWGEHPIAVPTTSDHRDRVSNRGHLENGKADAEQRRALS
jgi:hypothetical protein